MRFTVARGFSGVLLLAFVAALALRSSATSAQGGRAAGIPVDADDIAGTVMSTRGPEAGVWVIAETTDTPTKFRKIVVTDEQGRYLLPDLPDESHVPDLGSRLWPGRFGASSGDGRAGNLALTAAVAAERARRRAASTRRTTGNRSSTFRRRTEFPGTGPTGNGISPEMRRSITGSIRSKRTATSAISWETRRRARSRRRSAHSRGASTPGIAACRTARTAPE